MIKRIVEIGNPVFVHMRLNQMIVEKDGAEVGSVPIEDLGVLILDDPGIRCSIGLLRGCWETGTAVLFSDEKHLPGAMLVPFSGNVMQTRFIAAQVNLTEPSRKRIWQEIVRAKLSAQASAAEEAGSDAGVLWTLADKVRSGDPDNLEGQGAKRYWNLMFGNTFRRDRELPGINGLLNYGYAILRAAVARSITAAGLHPSLGVHHHSQYDAFTLADDLMEPFRPAVDRIVRRLVLQQGEKAEVSKETKPELLGLLYANWDTGSQILPFMLALQSYTASVRDVMLGERKNPVFPMPSGESSGPESSRDGP